MSYVLFCLATTFIILFSIIAIDSWPSGLARVSILLASVLPFSMAVAEGIPNWINEKKMPPEVILLVVVLFFGMTNMFVSEETLATVKGMGLFLVTGPCVLITTRLLVNSYQRRIILFHILTGCLLLLCFLGVYQYFIKPWGPNFPISLLSLNPIPAASLLLLLISGPILLLSKADRSWNKIYFGVVALFGILIVVLSFKKGPTLGLLVAFVFFGFFFIRKFGICIVVFTVLLTGYASIGYFYEDINPYPFGRDLNSAKFQDKYLNSNSALVRIELFRFAKLLFEENPLLGIGYNASLIKHLPGNYETKFLLKKKKHLSVYQNKFVRNMEWLHYPLEEYFATKSKNTLDNMVLSLVVETGVLFSFSYMMLLFSSGLFILKAILSKGINRSEVICLVAILLGFFVHSLTFDSFKYPNLNWVFHMLIGMAANLYFSRHGDCFNLSQGKTHKEI